MTSDAECIRDGLSLLATEFGGASLEVGVDLLVSSLAGKSFTLRVLSPSASASPPLMAKMRALGWRFEEEEKDAWSFKL